MKVNYTGCTLCNSTWGNFYLEIEHTQLFFCCNTCASIFADIVNQIKKFYGLSTIDYIEIQGNYQKRSVKISSNGKEYSSEFSFLQGKIINFLDLPT